MIEETKRRKENRNPPTSDSFEPTFFESVGHIISKCIYFKTLLLLVPILIVSFNTNYIGIQISKFFINQELNISYKLHMVNITNIQHCFFLYISLKNYKHIYKNIKK